MWVEWEEITPPGTKRQSSFRRHAALKTFNKTAPPHSQLLSAEIENEFSHKSYKTILSSKQQVPHRLEMKNPEDSIQTEQ